MTKYLPLKASPRERAAVLSDVGLGFSQLLPKRRNVPSDFREHIAKLMTVVLFLCTRDDVLMTTDEACLKRRAECEPEHDRPKSTKPLLI